MKVYELVDSHLKVIERRIPWLSNRIGISESALRAVRYDARRQYTLETMVKIAIALDMDLNELKKIDWDNQEQGEQNDKAKNSPVNRVTTRTCNLGEF